MIPGLFKFLFSIVSWLELSIFTLLMYALSFLPVTVLERFYPDLFRYWCRSFVRALDVDLHLHQKNVRALPEHYILIANHPSAFEDIGIPALFNVSSLAKIEVRDWWLVGRISAAAGTLYVDRSSGSSRANATEQLLQAVLSGANIALYPEGGCKGRRLYKKFHHGAFGVSLRTGVPIVPVFLHYEAQQDFEWPDGVSLPKKIWQIMRSHNRSAHYYVHDAFDPAKFSDRDSYCRDVYQHYLKWQQQYLD